MVPDKGVKRSLFGFSCSAGIKNNILLLSSVHHLPHSVQLQCQTKQCRIPGLQAAQASSLGSPPEPSCRTLMPALPVKPSLSPQPHAWGFPPWCLPFGHDRLSCETMVEMQGSTTAQPNTNDNSAPSWALNKRLGQPRWQSAEDRYHITHTQRAQKHIASPSQAGTSLPPQAHHAFPVSPVRCHDWAVRAAILAGQEPCSRVRGHRQAWGSGMGARRVGGRRGGDAAERCPPASAPWGGRRRRDPAGGLRSGAPWRPAQGAEWASGSAAVARGRRGPSRGGGGPAPPPPAPAACEP